MERVAHRLGIEWLPAASGSRLRRQDGEIALIEGAARLCKPGTTVASAAFLSVCPRENLTRDRLSSHEGEIKA